MAEYCSTIRIEVLDLDASATDFTDSNVVLDQPGTDPALNPDSSILLDFDNIMEAEIDASWGSQAQDSIPVLSDQTIVRGRKGAVLTLNWSRMLEHGSPDLARRYQLAHLLAFNTGETVQAGITYSDQTGAAEEPAATTGRAHISASACSISNGSETLSRYTMRWEVGASVGAQPPQQNPFNLVMIGGENWVPIP